MLIVWGKTTRRRKAGVAAAFCPVCREITPVTVRAVNQVDHLYYVPLGRGSHVADEYRCTTCGLLSGIPAGRLRPARDYGDDLIELAARTGPTSEAELTARLELETRAAGGTITPGERLRLICESIASMEYSYVLARNKGARTSISAILQLLMIGGVIASAVMWYMWMNPLIASRPKPFPLWEMVVSGASLLLLATVVYRMRADRLGAVVGNLDLLGLSLAILEPTHDELETVLEALRKRNVEVARALTAQRILASIRLP